MVVSNIGRDIGPMLQLTKTMDIFKYDLLAHVHTKRSVALGGETGIKWMEFLLEHLLGPEGSFNVIMAEFERESRLGLVFPEDANNVGWTKNKALAIDLAERLDVNGAVPSQPEFPVGTMFWARPLALKQLFDAASVLIHELPSEPLRYDGTMLHAIERLLPSICISAGYSWATVHIPGVTR